MKTLKELEAMTDDELDAMLGKLLKITPDRSWKEGRKGFNVWPRYCTDLNACHEVEKGLTDDCTYIHALIQVCGNDRLNCFMATARQRTIALILTLQPQ